jgi:hypothetical protein
VKASTRVVGDEEVAAGQVLTRPSGPADGPRGPGGDTKCPDADLPSSLRTRQQVQALGGLFVGRRISELARGGRLRRRTHFGSDYVVISRDEDWSLMSGDGDVVRNAALAGGRASTVVARVAHG